MLLEDCTLAQALKRSLRLGKPFTGKLVEINLVMGIVKLALVVLAMVLLGAAPLPFSDELGSGAMHVVWVLLPCIFLSRCQRLLPGGAPEGIRGVLEDVSGEMKNMRTADRDSLVKPPPPFPPGGQENHY